MSEHRPVSLPVLALFRAMPIMAVASILHRFTGIVLVAGALYLCYLFDLAVAGPDGFAAAAGLVAAPAGKLCLWIVLTALAYHLAAGVRHLLLDFHLGDSLGGSRLGAWLSVAFAVAAAAASGLWLW